jgi:hypothetical protein
MNDSGIQHVPIVLGLAIALAMGGTLLASLAGRWIGGVWTTLLATLATALLAYQPLIGTSVFSGYDTDLLRRILLGAIPFTALIVLLSFKKVPLLGRLLFALLGPAALLYWIFCHFDLQVPRQTLFTHEVLPVSLAIFVCWLLIEPLAHRSPGAAAPIVVGSATAGVAVLLLLSSENQAGLMAPLIPATAGGAVLAALVAALIRRPVQFARGPVLLWLMLIAALFSFMWFDTEKLPLPYLYWIATAPLLAWIMEIGPLHRLKPYKRETIRLVLVLIPVVIGVVLAYKQHKKEAAESGDEYSWIDRAQPYLTWPHPAAPIRPSQIPIPKTINPPTIT